MVVVGHHDGAHHIGGDAIGSGTHAVAQSQHRQGALQGRVHHERFLAAHPMRGTHRHLLDPVEAVFFQFLDNPVQGFLQHPGTRQPVRIGIHVIDDPVPDPVVVHGRLDQASGIGLNLRRQGLGGQRQRRQPEKDGGNRFHRMQNNHTCASRNASAILNPYRGPDFRSGWSNRWMGVWRHISTPLFFPPFA